MGLIKYRSIILGDVKIMKGAFIRYCVIKGKIFIGQDASLFRTNLIGQITISEKPLLQALLLILIHLRRKFYWKKVCYRSGHDNNYRGHDRNVKPKSFSSGGIRTEEKIQIGNDVWIGTRAIILGACEIKNNVTIAAGTVLLGRKYGPDKFYAGVPAHEK